MDLLNKQSTYIYQSLNWKFLRFKTCLTVVPSAKVKKTKLTEIASEGSQTMNTFNFFVRKLKLSWVEGKRQKKWKLDCVVYCVCSCNVGLTRWSQLLLHQTETPCHQKRQTEGEWERDYKTSRQWKGKGFLVFPSDGMEGNCRGKYWKGKRETYTQLVSEFKNKYNVT